MSAVILMAGAPGCGKTSWLRERGLEPYAIRYDDLRRLVTGSEGDQSANREVVKLAQDIMFQRILNYGQLTVLDATNARISYRSPVISLARMKFMPVIVVFFNVPPDECMRRQASRERQVPQHVVEAIWRDLTDESGMAELRAECTSFVNVDVDGSMWLAGRPIPWLPGTLRSDAFGPVLRADDVVKQWQDPGLEWKRSPVRPPELDEASQLIGGDAYANRWQRFGQPRTV